MCAPSRNSAFYQDFIQLEEQASPEGMIYVITDNLSSHDSKSTRAWLEHHPRIRHAFIPKGACWLNLQQGCGGRGRSVEGAVAPWLLH
jgi:DDE superfamily endonuclease